MRKTTAIGAGILLVWAGLGNAYADDASYAGMKEVIVAASTPFSVKNVDVPDEGNFAIWLVADEGLACDETRLVAGSVSLILKPNAYEQNEDVLVDSGVTTTMTGVSVVMGSGDMIVVWINDGMMYITTKDNEDYYSVSCGSIDNVQLCGSTFNDVYAYVSAGYVVSDSSSSSPTVTDESTTKSAANTSSNGDDSKDNVEKGKALSPTDSGLNITNKDESSGSIQIIPINADYHTSAE